MSDTIPFSDADLMAYADGAADAELSAAIEKLPAAIARAHRLTAELDGLSAHVFRVTCPDTQTLGEFQQKLLSAAALAEVAAHTATCPHCQAELASLAAFMAAAEPAGVLAKLKVLAARLVSGGEAAPGLPGLAPALAGLRGGEAGPLIYETDDETQISLEIQDDADRPGYRSILGLVMAGHEEPWQVELRGENGSEQLAVNPTGEFELTGLAPGRYKLIFTGSETQIVISRLVI